MKKINMLAAVVASLVLCKAPAAMADVVVIVNPANASALDGQAVKRIFLGKEKKFPGGGDATPFNQVSDSSARSQFDEQVLERSSSQISAYWSKLVFTGKGIPPKEVSDDAAAIAAVVANPGAISYVDSASVTDAVKVVSIN